MSGAGRKRKLMNIPKSTLQLCEVAQLVEVQKNSEEENRTILKSSHYGGYEDLVHLKQKIVDENDEYQELPTEFVYCNKCLTVFSKGGNLRRHATIACPGRDKLELNNSNGNRKITEYQTNKLPEVKKAALLDLLTAYCLKSGRSFLHIESVEFQSMIVGLLRLLNPSLKECEVSRQLPSRRTLQASCETKAQQILKAVFAKVVPYMEMNRCSIVVDYGRQHNADFLSAYLSFIEDDKDAWRFRVRLLDFKALYSVALNVYGTTLFLPIYCLNKRGLELLNVLVSC